MTMSETDVVNSTARAIKVAHPTSWVMKSVGAYGQAGIPDLLVSVSGRMIALEVELTDAGPSDLKFQRMYELRRSGATVAVVASVRESLAVIDEALGYGHARKSRQTRFTS